MLAPKWKYLSLEEKLLWKKSGNPNGCGAKGHYIFGVQIRPPHHKFFKADCDIHDYGYEFGENEQDRLEADLGLMERMKEDVERLPLIKQPYYYIWIYLYYIFLRLFGKKAFYNSKI